MTVQRHNFDCVNTKMFMNSHVKYEVINLAFSLLELFQNFLQH